MGDDNKKSNRPNRGTGSAGPKRPNNPSGRKQYENGGSKTTKVKK